MTPLTILALFGAALTACLFQAVQGQCTLPEEYSGTWYHRAQGDDTTITVSSSPGVWDERDCHDIRIHASENGTAGRTSTIMLKSRGANCYICTDVLYRSGYILQVRTSGCKSDGDISKCPGMTKLPGIYEVYTMFKDQTPSLNCIDSIEGTFQFSYEIGGGGGGICNHSQNVLDACQVPGSPNYDNLAFSMSFKKCPAQQNSFNRDTRFQCLGRWDAVVGSKTFTFIALTDSVQRVAQDKFKCLITLRDQHAEDNTIRWGMSRFGDCRQLKSLEDSPIRIVLRRIAPKTEYMVPRCTLPRNLTGTWFTQGLQFASRVWINETHIHYRTLRSRYDYEETWFSCQAQLDTRYLMTKVVVGRCEINFVCFDMAPRHQGIVRYRVGRPLKLPIRQGNTATRSEDFLTRTFRETCSWQWLTLTRENADWKYEVLIQDPPSPVACPIGGRYYFDQRSTDPYQLYGTRIRGVTVRPRNQIKCLNNVSEIKSCATDLSRIEVDAWYCETVDYRGRPIGEYDEPDHILTCTGHWMEDMKSYLITYDEEDAISRFRCWVYERISWTEIAMSRAETARCPRDQRANSNDIEGARLYMVLTEQERLYDDCPQRFDAGVTPSHKPRTLFRLYDGSAAFIDPDVKVLMTSLVVLVAFFFR
ncbi:uncharacterized protein LOC101854563 [Aplysia californica]|uniref:Uncharacterized protein LOC101854563 n=1 Tax=Aplysia californica TaxID=6500 RepID=A0ABM0JKH1_APLCA|nr:uncharacterized protein LOC101854563 [Aplysia californica]